MYISLETCVMRENFLGKYKCSNCWEFSSEEEISGKECPCCGAEVVNVVEYDED